MLKKFICSAFAVAALCGTGTTPAQADELYIRNRPFKDVYFSGGTAYVPVDGFLKAIRVPWRTSGAGNIVTIGQGSSPSLNSGAETITLIKGDDTVQLGGIIRNGRLYVNTKEISEATGYGLIYNRSTGVFDVVKSRFTNESDEKAAEELVAAKEAAKAERDAAWQKRVEKARADRKAKEEAKQAAMDKDEDDDDDPDDMEDDADDTEDDEDVLEAKGDPDVDASDTVEAEDVDDEDFDTTDNSKEMPDNDKVEKKEAPKKADLVVLSTDAAPNLYTGEVKFSAVLQNQGYADATKVKARFVAVGPDGKTWVSKTLFHGDIKPDGRWVITEDYTHRLKGAAPRGEFTVTVEPEFDSKAPKE